MTEVFVFIFIIIKINLETVFLLFSFVLKKVPNHRAKGNTFRNSIIIAFFCCKHAENHMIFEHYVQTSNSFKMQNSAVLIPTFER